MMRQWFWSEIGEVIILIKTITHALSFSPVKKKILFLLGCTNIKPPNCPFVLKTKSLFVVTILHRKIQKVKLGAFHPN